MSKIMLIENNFNLYKSNKIMYIESLNYAKNLSIDNIINKKLIFHLLWRVPKNFGRKQAAVLKSIIVHHYDYIDNLQINLWSNVDLSKNDWLLDISKYINFKYWNFDIEKKGTIFENYKHINNDILYDSKCYIEGDFFRLLILHKYGGFYIDMDVLVLRSMLPLNDYEFLYQWGTSGNKYEKLSMNGAIMKIDKNSSLSNEFLELLCNNNLTKNTTCCGNNLYSKLKKNNILVLPCIWFNSEWGFEDTILEPFKKINKIDLFDGAFTWHWHNKWDDLIEQGSKFQILEEKHNNMFTNILKNIN
jgi:hypothetical protein